MYTVHHKSTDEYQASRERAPMIVLQTEELRHLFLKESFKGELHRERSLLALMSPEERPKS